MSMKTTKKSASKKLHLATITILVKDREKNSTAVNQILTENGHLILARLGVNVQRHCIEHCTAIITITVEATASDVAKMTKKINNIYGIVAKACVVV
jgi:putative iron-only hydrogenase system regulator